jgi:bla regulator protein BlaR1
MRALLEVGLSNALVACVAAVLAVGVGLCCRRPALVHALWLLVLLKLITPPLIRVNLPWPNDPAPAPVVTDNEEIVPAAPPAGGEVVEMPFEEPEWFEEEAVFEAPAPVAGPETPPVVAASPAWSIAWPETLAAVWLLGSLGWFTLATGRAWRFSRLLSHSVPAPAGLVRRIEELSRLVGLPGCPEVRLLPGRVAPMLWGAFRPVLLLPEGLRKQLDDEGLDTLIVHELAHLRRRDPFVRVLEFVALGLFWWHPVAWYARRELRQAEEQCCDAWVVRVLPGAARTYAVALVDALDFLCEPRPVLPPLACGIGEVADLKRRLKMILSRSTSPALGWFAGLGVLGLALLLLPLVPSISQAQAPAPKDGVKKFDADTDLDKIKEEMKRKMEEIELLKKKFAELARAEDAKKKAAEELARAEKKKEIEARGGSTIRIEISGASATAEDLEKIARMLEKALGKEVKVIVLRAGQGMGGGFGFAVPKPGTGSGKTWKFEVQPGQPSKVAEPAKPGAAPKPPQPPGGDRIEKLEKKLEDIMKRLESLHRDMQKRGGGGGEGGKGVPGVPPSPPVPPPGPPGERPAK